MTQKMTWGKPQNQTLHEIEVSIVSGKVTDPYLCHRLNDICMPVSYCYQFICKPAMIQKIKSLKGC